MMGFKRSQFLLVVALLFYVQTVLAQKDSSNVKNKFIPDLVRLQYAGNVGLASVGPSWLLFKDRLEVGASFGLIPSNAYSKTFYSTTIKAMYSPKWSVDYRRYSWQPLSVGGVVSKYHGLDLSRYRKNEYYPDNYYWWGIKTRVGLAVDTELNMHFDKGPFSDVSLYLEASLWDVYFFSVYANNNDDFLGVTDLLVMGTGVKFFLR